MQLRTARLCLDCEEVHADWRCPVCASGSFTYLTRWIPVEDRRRDPQLRKPQPEPPQHRSKWVARGAMGVALVAASRVLWNIGRPTPGNGDTDAAGTDDATDLSE